MPKKTIGLYIHIPYCLSKCPYCDFYSNAGKADYKRYIDAVMLHLEDYSESLKDRTVDTIYIGGGTPSIIPRKLLCELIDTIYEMYDVAEDAEITLEANPATLNASVSGSSSRELMPNTNTETARVGSRAMQTRCMIF